MLSSLPPTVENRFVLPVVVGASQREGVLRPDNERGPVPAEPAERRLQRADFGTGHADVNRAVGKFEDVFYDLFEELRKYVSEIVVFYFASVPVVVHVVRRIRKNHIGGNSVH